MKKTLFIMLVALLVSVAGFSQTFPTIIGPLNPQTHVSEPAYHGGFYYFLASDTHDGARILEYYWELRGPNSSTIIIGDEDIYLELGCTQKMYVSFYNPGNYTITLKVYTHKGWSQVSSRNIWVNADPNLPINDDPRILQ